MSLVVVAVSFTRGSTSLTGPRVSLILVVMSLIIAAVSFTRASMSLTGAWVSLIIVAMSLIMASVSLTGARVSFTLHAPRPMRRTWAAVTRSGDEEKLAATAKAPSSGALS